MRKERWVISGDWHVPFHDPRLCDLVLDVASDIGATHFLVNGDYLDLYGVNMHGPKNPRVLEHLSDEFEQGVEWLERMRQKLPSQKIHINMGNHETRLERWILRHAKPFWNILTIDNMLQFDKYDITTSPYQEVLKIPGLPIYITHSPPSYSENSANVSLKKKGEGNWIFSCTHRVGYAQKVTSLGSVYECFTMGWLGSTTMTESHKEVFSFTKGHHEWGHSFIIVDVVGDVFFINQHIIRNYKCVVDGFIYEG